MPDELLRAALRCLDDASPDGVIDALRQLLARHMDATDVDVLVVDPELTALRSVEHMDVVVSTVGEPAGRAFMTHDTVFDTSSVDGAVGAYVPVSVFGDSVGVLRIEFPTPPEHAQLSQLRDIALVVGHVIMSARRHTDLFHTRGRPHRLSLPDERQWQLLPGTGFASSMCEIAGSLDPSGAHVGNFDWSQSRSHLQFSASGVSSPDRDVPLLTTLAVTAVRNARRAGLDIVGQACLAGQAVFAHHQGRYFLDTVMFSVELSSGHASVIKAGSSQVLLIRGGCMQPLELADQVPLGGMEEVDYGTQEIALATGDRLLLVFGEPCEALNLNETESLAGLRLRALLEASADHSPRRVVHDVVASLKLDHDGDELLGGLTIVCVDWKGPGAPESLVPWEPAHWSQSTGRHLRVVPPLPDDGEPEQQTVVFPAH